MICGDGDFRVNLRKRHGESIRPGNLECSNSNGEKYRDIFHAEFSRIINHRSVVRMSWSILNHLQSLSRHTLYFPIFLPFVYIRQYDYAFFCHLA